MDEQGRPAWAGRVHQLQSSLQMRGVEAFVVSTPVNVTYLTGFNGSTSLLLLTPDEIRILVDGRYELAVRDAVRDDAMVRVGVERVEKRYDLTLASLVERQGWRRIGFEAAYVTVATLGTWQRASPDVEWVPFERVVEKQRMVKDATEVACLRRAGAAIVGVAAQLHEIVRRHRTEREVADGIEGALLAAGFERPAFPTIVASGPNSAHPHARPTHRRLAPGDLVVLDFGGVLDGYCVDLTRMAAVGSLALAGRSLYEAVRAANAAAIRVVRPGIETSTVDAAARAVLEARGYGEAFLHATGHGLGLEVHEAPRIARADPDTTELLQRDMVFTVEPGAYIEGVGGVRLEDDVLVTADGSEVLTEVSRELLVV